MLRKEIKYKDFFSGEEETTVAYFNLTKTELQELQYGTEGGYGAAVTNAIEQGDVPKIFAEFRTIVLKAYGVREGNRFVKSDELSKEFTETAAWDAFFSEITSDLAAMNAFLVGIIPDDVAAEINFDDITGEVEALQNPEGADGES